MRLSAIIVAAGSSTRAGFDKVFARIDGRSVLQISTDAFEKSEYVDEIVIVCGNSAVTQATTALAEMKKIRAIVSGGARRQDSVVAGLNAISPSAEYIAVHDAARPLITPREIERVFAAARANGAAVLAGPVTDTLKRADENQFVSGSVDRGNLFAMQTPQIFARQLLLDAYERIARERMDITDEVSAVQNCGGKVAIVPAREHNMKITFASDLELAGMIIRQR